MKSKLFKNEQALAWVVSILLALVIQGNGLFQPLVLTDDIAIHHVWLEGGVEKGFVENDPWLLTAHDIQPYALSSLWQLLGGLLPTLLMGKSLALVLLAITGWCIFQVGSALRSPRAGWIAMGLLFASDAWIGISGGFARSFAWPLVCGFLAAMLLERRAWVAVCLFFSAAFYPVVFVLLVPTYGIFRLCEALRASPKLSWRQTLNARAEWLILVSVFLGAFLVLLKSRELSHHPLVGPQVSLAELQSDPIYGVHGRVPFWPQPSLLPVVQWGLLPWDKAILEPVVRHASAMPTALRGGATVLLTLLTFAVPGAALFWIFRQNSQRGWVLLALALGAVFTFAFASLLLPRLYEPARYVVWSMPVLAVVAWAVVLDVGIGWLKSVRLRVAACLCLALVIASRLPSIRGKGAEDVSEYAALYQELSRTEPGQTIACFPRTGDFIPLLSHRSVFTSYEASHAILFSHYKEMVMDRHAAFVKAFYAETADEVRSFCHERSIQWLVVEEKYYRADLSEGFYFAPFEGQVRQRLKETPVPWLLQHARKSGKEVQSGVFLLNANTLPGWTSQS